jgi:hypothetical protein
VERHLPQWLKTRVGTVMIQKACASLSHAHVRVGQTPDRSSDSSLASRRQSGLCCSGCVAVPGTQMHNLRLQLISRGKFIAHFTTSLESFADMLSRHAWQESV